MISTRSLILLNKGSSQHSRVIVSRVTATCEPSHTLEKFAHVTTQKGAGLSEDHHTHTHNLKKGPSRDRVELPNAPGSKLKLTSVGTFSAAHTIDESRTKCANTNVHDRSRKTAQWLMIAGGGCVCECENIFKT